VVGLHCLLLWYKLVTKSDKEAPNKSYVGIKTRLREVILILLPSNAQIEHAQCPIAPNCRDGLSRLPVGVPSKGDHYVSMMTPQLVISRFLPTKCRCAIILYCRSWLFPENVNRHGTGMVMRRASSHSWRCARRWGGTHTRSTAGPASGRFRIRA
jgi:hypothetical protein